MSREGNITMDSKERNERVCPICKSAINNKIAHIKLLLPDYIRLPSEYNVVSCCNCGFCFSDTKATAEDYDQYYMNSNVYSGVPAAETHWDALHSCAGKYIDELLNKESHILDMGFGQGRFLLYLKKLGYGNIVGIDPSPESVENIKKENIYAAQGSIMDAPSNGMAETMDCVFLFDVIEHLLFPREALEKISGYIKEEGYLMFSVPNYENVKFVNAPIPNQFNQEHINYFSEKSIDNLLSGIGYKRIDITTVKDGEELFAVYQKANCKHDIIYDDLCCKSIEEYISRQNILMGKSNQIIKKLLCNNVNKIYLWGTGAYAMWLLANTELLQFDITYIDNNPLKIGKEFNGKIIQSVSAVNDMKVPVLICSMLNSDAIIEQMHTLGLENEYYCL